MARFVKTGELNRIEQVAGNGLLHRRALLRRGVAFAGALGAGVGLRVTKAAAEPLAEAPWGQEPGDPVPAYQTPSKFAKKVVRSLSNPNFEPRTSQSRAPHQLLDGMITPNGVFRPSPPANGCPPSRRWHDMQSAAMVSACPWRSCAAFGTVSGIGWLRNPGGVRLLDGWAGSGGPMVWPAGTGAAGF